MFMVILCNLHPSELATKCGIGMVSLLLSKTSIAFTETYMCVCVIHFVSVMLSFGWVFFLSQLDVSYRPSNWCSIPRNIFGSTRKRLLCMETSKILYETEKLCINVVKVCDEGDTTRNTQAKI